MVAGLPTSGQLNQAQFASGTVTINAWSNNRVMATTGLVVKADRYNGYVITGAQQLSDVDRLTVETVSGGELVAQIVEINREHEIALVKVNGLTQNPAVFSQGDGETGEPIWSAWRREGQLIVVPGHVTSSSADKSLAIKLAFANDHGGLVLNECGEVVGFQAVPEVPVVRQSVILGLLNQLNIRPIVSSERCISAVQKARQTAEQANEAAQKAQQEALAAQSVAQQLARQLEVSNERNQQLVEDAARAKQTAESAILAARRAQEHAEQTRIELERQTAMLAAETEAMVQHLKHENEAAEQRFRETLEAQQRTAAQREDVMLVALVVLFVLVIAAFVIMLRRGRMPQAILTRIQDSPESPRPASIEAVSVETPGRTVPARDQTQEYLFEGRDEDGIRYLLRVSGSQLGNGIVIGRETTHMINHVDVSRQHAKMSVKQNRLLIEDLGSTNGTSVNGQAIEDKGPVLLNNGDQIIFGSVVMNLKVLSA